jgi:hypothetical protein
MSIHVLKLNSRRFQTPISGQKNGGFALNGTRRNIGGILKTANLGKSVTRTPFRGTEPMGNGGCCGTYKRVISNSGSCCSNDPTIVKLSTKTTSGMIDTKYKWTKSTWPRYTVKPLNSMPLNYTQGQYIPNIVSANTTCVIDKEVLLNRIEQTEGGNAVLKNIKNCKAASYHIGGKKYIRKVYSKNLNPLPVSSSEYQRGFLQKKNCLPTPPCKAAFPMTLVRTGCDTNYLTPEEAIAGGLLPENWMQPGCAGNINL